MYNNDDIQKMLDKCKENGDFKRLVISLVKENDAGAVNNVIADGSYESFDKYDSAVCENFITAYEEAKKSLEEEIQKMIDECRENQNLSDDIIRQLDGDDYMAVEDVLLNGSCKRFDLYDDDVREKFIIAYKKAKEGRKTIQRETVAAIIDTFEDFLDEKKVRIENADRDAEDAENQANIYGEDFDKLMNQIIEILAEERVDVPDTYEEVI